MRNRKKMLGARVKELRKAKGFSQDQLSETVAIESNYLSRIEVGGCYPSLDVLERIADALRVEMHDLFLFVHHDPDATSKKGLEDILSSASPDERKLIYKIIKAVRQ
ncbi:MAG: helix-turn-helix transcriptional regulator [Geobacter sp.]|nr:helix-turn-helix transcriptional regulator [Geobacter sp.]